MKPKGALFYGHKGPERDGCGLQSSGRTSFAATSRCTRIVRARMRDTSVSAKGMLRDSMKYLGTQTHVKTHENRWKSI